MNILYVYADRPEEYNCTEWRCAIPYRAINRKYPDRARMVFINEWVKEGTHSEWADVIVLQRLAIGMAMCCILHWRARGKTVLLDLDDSYELMPESLYAARFWKRGEVEVLNEKGQRGVVNTIIPPIIELARGAKLVHAVTSPSRLICQDWAERGISTCFIPNYIDTATYEVEKAPSVGDITIGWGGSMTHVESWKGSGVAQALERVLAKLPQTHLVIAGDIRVYNQVAVPTKRKTFYPWGPFQKWPAILRTFDVGLIPLSGNYDRRRSPIKVLEYGLMDIPWIGSEHPALKDYACYGRLVPNGPKAWERMILDTIASIGHPVQAERIASAHHFALSQSIDENVDTLLGTYQEIANAVQTGSYEVQSFEAASQRNLGDSPPLFRATGKTESPEALDRTEAKC